MTDQRAAAPEASDRSDPAPEPAVGAPRPPRPGRVPAQATGEVGGPDGPEPTRYGDWERKGRVSDF